MAFVKLAAAENKKMLLWTKGMDEQQDACWVGASIYIKCRIPNKLQLLLK